MLTDDDVPRDPDWLARLETAVRDRGAVTGTPLFAYTGAGRVLGWVHEPAQALVAPLMLVWGDGCWGGACGFHRRHVDDEDALVAALGARRWMTVFAPISLMLNALVMLHALATPAFEWPGRTCRWTDTFDVEIRR